MGLMGPIQALFAQLMAQRQRETLAPDPRNVDSRSPESYSDFVRLFSQPAQYPQPAMPFRMPEQAGPEPPVNRARISQMYEGRK